MTIFAIYKYVFTLADEGDLFVEGTTERLLDKAQEIFDGMITGDKPFPVSLPKRDNTATRLDNEVVCKRGRVSLLMICNEKSKKIMEKKDEQEITYHPGCYVVIDNREGVANVAIERPPAFDGNPDRVCRLLEKAINDKFVMEHINLKVELRSKVRETTLWQMVDNQTTNYRDKVTKVSFSFPNPKKVAGIDADGKMKGKLKVLSAIANALNAAKGTFHVEANKNDALRLERTQEDLAQMVHLCSRNAYDIAVHFKHYGLYRFGADEKALSLLDDEIIKDFCNGHLAMLKDGSQGFGLEEWLDEVRHTTEKDFKDATPAKKTRKRRNKEAV